MRTCLPSFANDPLYDQWKLHIHIKPTKMFISSSLALLWCGYTCICQRNITSILLSPMLVLHQEALLSTENFRFWNLVITQLEACLTRRLQSRVETLEINLIFSYVLNLPRDKRCKFDFVDDQPCYLGSNWSSPWVPRELTLMRYWLDHQFANKYLNMFLPAHSFASARRVVLPITRSLNTIATGSISIAI